MPDSHSFTISNILHTSTSHKENLTYTLLYEFLKIVFRVPLDGEERRRHGVFRFGLVIVIVRRKVFVKMVSFVCGPRLFVVEFVKESALLLVRCRMDSLTTA